MDSKREYKVVMIETDDVTTIPLTLEQLITVLPTGSDYEYKYALAENIDAILDLKQYEKLTFNFNRDNPESLGIILRTK